MTFKNLGLSTELLRALSEKGYSEPTPIQSQVIPFILQGGDLLAGAQTGTGKTAGFVLPILHKLIRCGGQKAKVPIRSLILTPTRELAVQVEENVRSYGRYLPFKSTAVFGGVNIHTQIRKLRNSIDLLVATPGRLLDLIRQNAIDLSYIETLVLDEADRMLDMGFIHDIKEILKRLPKKRQNLMFSATFSEQIKKLAHGFLNAPKTIQVAKEKTTSENITQIVHPVDNHRKRELLSYLIKEQNWNQVLVFTRTKHAANKLSHFLDNKGIRTAAIHGNKTQSARMKALSDFKRGFVQVLVATDIAARGIDIDQLPVVVNFELPQAPEDYVHRIGRTGRAGHEGKAISLVSVDEQKLLKDIERLIKIQIEKVTIADFIPDPTIQPQPIQRGRFPPKKFSRSTKK